MGRLPTVDEIAAGLAELAGNLRWTWDRPTQDVFRAADPQWWDAHRSPPPRVATPEDPGFVDRLRRARAGLAAYLADRPSVPEVAYFCMEHAVAPNLRIYAGGLGALAGDIEKTASDLRVPMVAVGLRYKWRLRQRLSYGWQHEEWEPVVWSTAMLSLSWKSPLASKRADGAPFFTSTVRSYVAPSFVYRET